MVIGVADAATVGSATSGGVEAAKPGPYAEDLGPAARANELFTDLGVHAAYCIEDFAETGRRRRGRAAESRTATFLYDQLFVKHASNAYARNASTPWHADGSYWAVRGRQIASVAIALDEHY